MEGLSFLSYLLYCDGAGDRSTVFLSHLLYQICSVVRERTVGGLSFLSYQFFCERASNVGHSACSSVRERSKYGLSTCSSVRERPTSATPPVLV